MHLVASALMSLSKSQFKYDIRQAWRKITNLFHVAATMSAETITSIIFGLLQLTIGLVALWQQYQMRQLHRMLHHLLILICY